MADDDAKLLADSLKLPIDERAAHSNWKVRTAAYDAIKTGCSAVFDSSDPVLSEYVVVFAKATADGNAAALDKALEALQAFLEKASDATAARIAGTASSNIVKKALGARPGTAAKGVDCLMGFVEVEQAEKVTTALVEGYTHKVPKVVVGSLDATLQLIRAFGGRVMPAQQILKAMPPLFESKDVKARDKVKEIVAELGRWMGPELIRAAMFEKMRDAMKEDVEKLLQEAPAGRPKPERLTRKEAAKAAVAAAATDADGPTADGAAAAGSAGGAVAEEPEQVDSYEFAEPRDIIPELKKEFWDGLASAKWNERKGALTSLRELAAYPHLANGDYADVNREIKKIITKDSNIQVVAEAINCTANIAKGLRKDYRGPAMTLCPVLLEKFKDKAAVVGKAAAEALDNMARYSFALPDVAEDIAAALAHQNPKVKESTLAWLTGCVGRENKAGVLKLLPLVIPAAAKCTDEGAPSIREAAFACLVQVALKAGSLAALDKGLAKMDDAKRKKLEEQVLEAAKGRKPGAPSAAAAAAPAASRGSSRAPSKPASGAASPCNSPRGSVTGAGSSRPATSRPAAVRSSSSNNRPASAGVKTRAQTAAATAASGGGSSAAAAGEEDEAALSTGLMSSADVKARFTEWIGEEAAKGLAAPEWKMRLEVMETVVAKAQEPDAAENTALLVQAMAHLPGWDEKNFQVMTRQFEVIRTCAAYPAFTKREALVAVNGATDKLSDLKLKEPASQMLLAAAEAAGPQLVASLLYKKASVHKNPKVLTETFNWISNAVADFLLPAFNVKALIDWAKAGLGSANAATRTAATQLLGTMHAFLGPALADMVRPDLKPALMATVEVEFGKQPQRSDWQATRVSRASAKATGPGKGGSKGRSGSSAAAAAEEPPSMDDLLPRADISGQITGELVGKLGSANWKERKEGLDEVDAILTAAGGRIQPSVGDLMPALKGRFSDSNRNLGAQALVVLAHVAKAMGKPIAREARPILGPAVKCICDAKHNVRAAVIELLEAWASVAPPDAAFDEVVDVLPSPKCVSEGMQAAISWMASVYAAGKGSSAECIAAAAKAAALGAGYKTVPVREAAAALLEAMVTTLGLADVQRAVHDIRDKALAKSAMDALAKITAAGGGAGAAAMAVAPAAAASIRPPTPRGGNAGSRPGTAGGAGLSSRNSSRPGSAASSRAGSAGGVGLAAQASTRSLAATATGSVLSRAGAAAAALATGGADGPLLALDKGKEERARKARFKSSKFEIRPDELQQLETDLGALASPGLKANLFAKDFKRQVQAADALKAWLTNSPDEAFDPCVACLDLVLRWSVVRLADGNTQTLVSVTSMLKVLFDLLASNGYRLSEAEVKVFMPGLVEKCGQPQPNVKADCRDLMVRVASMYPAAKVLAYIQEGLHSKNNRSRVACAEEIACMVEREGPKVYSGAKCDVLAALAKLLAESGKEIRAAALGALEVVYLFEGEAIYKQLGNLNGQQKGIVEERFKKVDKELAKKGLVAGYKRAAFEAAAAAAAASTEAQSAAATMNPSAAGPQPAGYSSRPGLNYSAAPGVLSSSAGLVCLNAVDAAGGPGRGGTNTSALLNTDADSAAAMQHPSLLMTGPPGQSAATAAGVAGGIAAAGFSMRGPPAKGLSVAAPEPALHAAGPGSSAAGPQHYQPLQSFSSQAEIYAEFDKCLGVLQSGALDDVIEVMKLLCYEMMDLQRTVMAAEKGQQAAPAGPNAEVVYQLLQRQADTLVVLLTMQTQQVFTVASAIMAQGQLPQPQCRACKYALNTLMNIFSSNSLPQGLRQETLAGLVRTLLLRLVDDNLGRQAEGEALLKALNVLMLKILENSNRNFTFSALLTLLLDTPPELGGGIMAAGGDPGVPAMQQQQMQQARWADLVVKCLIKSTKALPQVIQSIDLRSLLLAIHGFFEALGVEEIRRRSQADDKPLRMVKTILHELCKLKGTDIYRYTADIPQQGSTSGTDGKPVIFPYIDLNIQTLVGNGTIRSAAAGIPAVGGSALGPVAAAGMGVAASSCSVTPGRPAYMQPGAAVGTPGAGLRANGSSIVTKLSAVFKRLSTNMQTASIAEKRAALLDIYAISQEQRIPIEQLIAQYLPDTTPAFKHYLVVELNNIDAEQQQQPNPARANGSTDSDASSPWRPQQQQQQQGSVDVPSADVYHAAAQQQMHSGLADTGNGVAAGRLPATTPGNSSSSVMEALRARMSQLQSDPARFQVLGQGAAPPPGALAGLPASNLPELQAAAIKLPAMVPVSAAAGEASITAAAAQPAATRNLADLKSRMRGLTGGL